jgi:protein subunit release factor A
MTTITLPDAVVDEQDEAHELSEEELATLKERVDSLRRGEKTYSIEEMKVLFQENKEKVLKEMAERQVAELRKQIRERAKEL